MLSRNGETFSRSSGTGDFVNFKIAEGHGDAIFVETGPDYYMQLFFSKSLNQFVGNFYQKDPNNGTFKRVGTVSLSVKH